MNKLTVESIVRLLGRRRARPTTAGTAVVQSGVALDTRMTMFVERVAGVRHALTVSRDGLLAASSAGLGRDPADTAAAVTANVAMLAARSATLLEGGRAALTMIETVEGFVLLMPTTDGSVVVAWAVRPCDVGQIGYELAVLAHQFDPE